LKDPTALDQENLMREQPCGKAWEAKVQSSRFERAMSRFPGDEKVPDEAVSEEQAQQQTPES